MLTRKADGRRWSPGPYGIGMRLLFANSMVVIAGVAATIAVALVVGPPMFRRLMGNPALLASLGKDPYEHVFRDAMTRSVGIALAVSALVALTLSWYLSRRVHRSASELSHAATAVANGRYGIRVARSHLGKEFDAIADAFNQMAERLGAVEGTRRQLLADLAHEIRTPVSVLEAYMEAVEDNVRRLDHEAISMMRDQTRRLVRLTTDVTALANAEQGVAPLAPSWVAPEDLIATAATAFAQRYQAKDVALATHVQDNLRKIWADSERLGQVLGNLLDNALRHSRPQGKVELAAFSAGGVVSVTVSDTGDGVAADHLPYLFERFYRVDAARDRAHGGAGIGLAIAKALVEAHHGQIVVNSDGLGTGTTFTITLPTHQPTSRPTTNA